MSPLWSDRTVIFAGAGEVAVCHTPRGFGRAQIKHAFAAPRDTAVAASIRELLTKLPPSKGPVDVILSSLYTRLQLVAPDPRIAGKGERAAFSQMLFERDFGLGSGSFEQRLDRAAVKKPVLACAVDRAKLAEIIAACGGEKRVRSASPIFVVLFNRIRKRISDGLIASVEPGRLTVGFVSRGEWSRIASRPTEIGDTDALLQFLEDYRHDGMTGGACYLFDPDRSVTPPRGGRWAVRPVDTGESSLALAACALAA